MIQASKIIASIFVSIGLWGVGVARFGLGLVLNNIQVLLLFSKYYSYRFRKAVSSLNILPIFFLIVIMITLVLLIHFNLDYLFCISDLESQLESLKSQYLAADAATKAQYNLHVQSGFLGSGSGLTPLQLLRKEESDAYLYYLNLKAANLQVEISWKESALNAYKNNQVVVEAVRKK